MKTAHRSLRALIVMTSIIAGIGAAAVIYGAADSLSFNSQEAGAGNSTVPKCSTGGMTTFENVSGSNIVSVDVSNVDSACAGGTLSLTVNNGTITGSASSVVPGGGGAMTLTLGSAVPFIDNASVDLVVVGP
jgi:hypothetical protein